MMDKKRIKTKIGVGSVVKEKVGDMEEKNRECRRSRTRKYVVGYVQAVVWKEIFLVQFEDGQKKEMNYCSLQYFCSKEEVGLDMD